MTETFKKSQSKRKGVSEGLREEVELPLHP